MTERHRVLILGANGMLGHALADLFADLHPTLWDLADLDITNQEQVQEKIGRAQEPWTTVINAAAYTAVDAAETNEAVATRVNGNAVGNLVDACNTAGAKLVHFSTDYVFDGTNALGYAETDPIAPLNAYGRSKAAGERHMVERSHGYHLIRTAWLYGLHGQNFVETMLRLGRTGTALRVVNDQTGSPTYTRDLASATRALVTENAPSGVYHLTNAGQCTWYDFAREIFQNSGVSVDLQPVTTASFPRPARRPAFSVLRNTKRPALPTWQDALSRYLRER